MKSVLRVAEGHASMGADPMEGPRKYEPRNIRNDGAGRGAYAAVKNENYCGDLLW